MKVKHLKERKELAEANKGPVMYNGKVYEGMKVRPRGLGTPRRDQYSGEVYRSSLLAEQRPEGNAVAWGKYATQRFHYDHRKHAEAYGLPYEEDGEAAQEGGNEAGGHEDASAGAAEMGAAGAGSAQAQELAQEQAQGQEQKQKQEQAQEQEQK